MIAIQVIIILFIIFVLGKIYSKFKKNEISRKEFIFWSILWLIVAVAAFIPKTLDLLASYVGVGRGVDLLIYFSIVAIFYVVFKIYARIDKIERDITKVVRRMAIKEREAEDNKEN